MKKHYFILIVTLLINTSCMNISAKNLSKEMPDGETIVFGRVNSFFYLNGKSRKCYGNNSHVVLSNDVDSPIVNAWVTTPKGFRYITFDNGGMFDIGSSSPKDVFAYILKPGLVTFRGVTCAHQQKALRTKPYLIGHLEPNTAYYIGDISAAMYKSNKKNLANFQVNDNFEKTYNDLKKMTGNIEGWLKVEKKILRIN